MYRKLINLYCNTTNELKYSYDIDIDIDETSEYFEEEYLTEMYEFFNIYNPNCYYYDITTEYFSN